MTNVIIDGIPVATKDGDTILDAAKRVGVKIPTLCHIEGLSPTGACRMCLVDVEGFSSPVPACSYPVTEGMKIQTKTPAIIEIRRTILELLLSNHPDDCLYCGRSGSCELQDLSRQLGVRKRMFSGDRSHHELDVSSSSIIRDPDKCILCGKCVRVCEEIQGVAAIDFLDRGAKSYVGTAFNKGLNVSSCINCGQCIMVCPTGALTERSYVMEVFHALANPKQYVVAQHAPAVSVSIAEEFGVKPGKDFDGAMVATLRRLGFDKVFDTSFSADLTIMEEASELVHRVTTGGVLPMMTSCSPGWIKFVEQFFPDLMPNLSTCKSPQQMMGAIIKSFFAEREGLAPKDIVSVSIMPCTAKKFESGRPEMGRECVADVDYVLTTRELAELIRMVGIDIKAIAPESADTPFGERTGAGKIFGTSGGVMEAAIRTAHKVITGDEIGDLDVKPLRGLEGAKEIHIRVGDLEVGAAVVSGLGNARRLMDQIRAGRSDLHFIEVMTCPGGCINGGGQPRSEDKAAVKARMKALYDIDKNESRRVSHGNEWITRLYDEFLGEPLGHKSHELLHVEYHKRDVLL